MTDLQQPQPAPVDLDPDKLMAFVFRAVDEVGATLNAALVVMGDKLGYYRRSPHGPITPSRLAGATGDRRALRPGVAQRAGRRRLRRLRPGHRRYTLPPEHAVALTDEYSPAYLPGFFQIALGTVQRRPAASSSRRAAGHGVGWHEHNHDVHEGCERFFRPSYNAHLVAEWLPALTASSRSSRRGARVADVGCGHGARRS